MSLERLRRNEPAADACAAIAFYQTVKAKFLSPAQRDMLANDYSARRGELDEERRQVLDEMSHSVRTGVRLDGTGAGLGRRSRPKTVDVAILTVIRNELRAVRDVFDVDLSLAKDTGDSQFYPVQLAGRKAKRELSVIITKAVGALDLNAADAVRGILDHFTPSVVFLVGVAGGRRRKVSLGDVVVPKIIHHYGGGRREPEGMLPRHEVLNVPTQVHGNFGYYFPSREFFQKLSAFRQRMATEDRPTLEERATRFRPRIHVENAAVASGPVLAADGSFIEELRAHEERIVALDQESYGFAHACEGSWFGIVRGVSDYADADKVDGWQYMAAATAGLCLRDFLETEYLPKEMRNL